MTVWNRSFFRVKNMDDDFYVLMTQHCLSAKQNRTAPLGELDHLLRPAVPCSCACCRVLVVIRAEHSNLRISEPPQGSKGVAVKRLVL